jgi:xanthine/uracil permease
MAKVLAIFGEILSNPKIFNDAVKLKMKQILMNVNSNDFFKAGIQTIWGNLTDKQKTNLSNLANS